MIRRTRRQAAGSPEEYLRRLKTLANEQGIAWRYAPLHYFLNHPQEAWGDRSEKKGSDPGSR